MIKYFCDRCEEECSQTGKVNISMPRFCRTPLLCSSCQTTLENTIEDFLKNKYKENEKRLKRALWLARDKRAKEHVWHDVKTDGSPLDDYKGHDWVLVQYQENGGFLLIPRIAEYRKNLKRWVLIDEDDITPHHDYLLKYCRVIGWRDIDFAYYGRKFFVQQEINKNVERKCLAKAEEYK